MFRNQAVGAIIGVLGSFLLAAGTAAASGPYSPLAGPRLISAQGGASDINFDLNLVNYLGEVIFVSGQPGSIGVAGLIDFNNSGGANSVNVTVSFEDNFVIETTEFTPGPVSGLSCVLTDPADVKYSLSNGVGTLTLSVASDDSCTRTTDGTQLPANVGTASITFNLYVAARPLFQVNGRIEAVGITFFDALGNSVVGTSLTGSIQ
jgi:hypothetical protein